MKEFSDEQLRAIKARNKSLVLSASAGSGKTTVLVERIIRMVCDEGVDLERLVVVTFTNAAAAGIKSRLRNALKTRLDGDPGNEHIRKQLLMINSSNISTVHAFCGRMIKKYNYLLSENIPVNYKLMSEDEADILLRECLDEILDAYYEGDDEDFEAFIESYSPGRSDNELIDMTLKIYGDICCMPFYTERLENMRKSVCEKTPFEDTPFAEYLTEYIDKLLEGIISKYEFACDCIEADEGLEKLIGIFGGELEIFKNLYAEKNIKKRRDGFANISFEGARGAKRGADTSVILGIRNKIKLIVGDINELLCDFTEPTEQDRKKILVFFDILEKLDAMYKSRKYEDGCISFNDQEQLTVEILKNDEISDELKSFYYEIMVDEFQDTNDIQDYIFSRISRKNNLFIVGDVKQSIYRFRHANPSIFISKIKNAANDENSEVIYLNRNYRSSYNVADTVNLVMSYLMNKNICDIDYIKNDTLIPEEKIPLPKYNTEVILCDTDTDDEEMASFESVAIAKKINQLMSDGEFYPAESNRIIKYSDIAILVRSFNDKTLALLECLTKQGIPCRYDDKTNLFDTPELKMTLAFLRAIDNPTDDISLLATLRNVFQMSDEEIFELRLKAPKDKFYKIIAEERPDISDKIKELSLYAAKYGINSLIEKIFADYLIPEKWAAMGGVRRYDNLEMLRMLSYEFEQSGFKGVSAFLNHIDKYLAAGKKTLLPDSGGNEDYVRVMSIHKSKGLEFPIVILAGCGKLFNKMDLAKSVLADNDLGIGYNYINVEKRIKYPSIYKKVITKRMLHELICEEARILYVALTRAKYKIIITAGVRNSEKALSAYSQTTHNKEFAMSYSDFITASGTSALLIPPLLFADSLSHYGNYVPNESAPSFKKTEIEMTLSFCENVEMSEELTDGERIKSIIYNNRSPGEYSIVKYGGRNENVPGKISVTALNKLKESDTAVTGPHSSRELYRPDFSKKHELSAAQRGTMLHEVLEKIDLKGINSSDEILPYIVNVMKTNEVIRDNLTLEDAEKIEAFLSSPLGIKLRKSDKVYREKEFLMFMDSSEIYKTKENHKIMVQGIIDCCFEDNNDIILIDYKLTNMEEEKIKETYRYQIELYKHAISKLLNVEFSRIKAYLWDINRCISYKV